MKSGLELLPETSISFEKLATCYVSSAGVLAVSNGSLSRLRNWLWPRQFCFRGRSRLAPIAICACQDFLAVVLEHRVCATQTLDHVVVARFEL